MSWGGGWATGLTLWLLIQVGPEQKCGPEAPWASTHARVLSNLGMDPQPQAYLCMRH